MRSFLCFAVFFALLSGPTCVAQSWPTTDWEALSEDGQTPLTGDRATHAAVFMEMLEEASAWFASMGFRAPDLERSPTNANAFLARVKESRTEISSGVTSGLGASPMSVMRLTGDLDMTNPQSAMEHLMWGSPVHELLHASMWQYPAFRSVIYPSLQDGAPRLDRCPDGSDATLLGWFNEGASSVLQIRWYERTRGGRYGHPFTDPGIAAWVRQFDSPIHAGRVPPQFQNSNTSAYQAERAAGRSWRCGYGAWPFWYFAGNQLAKVPGQEVEYLRYILEQPSGWENGALEAVDQGLKDAAEAFDSPNRVNDGLFELYPAFIAEYADTTAFYEHPVQIDLRGRSEVKWHDDFIEPVASTAFKVSINIDDNQPLDQPSRFRVTLDPQAHRDQFHLIEGQRVFGQPLADQDPYQFEIPIRRDTTVLVRLANVAENAAETEGTQYAIRFELGGFYGAPASDPYSAPDVDIPPGFFVMSGPPELVDCSGGPEAGSVFDLVTRAEAVGDIRRAEDGANEMLDDIEDSLDDGEVPLPNATPAQREAMRRAMQNGAVSEAQMAEMRAAIQASRNRMEDQATEIEDVRHEMRQRFEGRSHLIASFLGQAGSESCKLLLAAVLSGEEGGPQQLSVADTEDYENDGPMPMGIESVGYLVGDVPELIENGEDDRYQICMMTPREQEREQERSCPVVCSEGQLILENASQGHAKGMLRAELIRRIPEQSTTSGCPAYERGELVFGFNITSANQGQDVDPLRGYSNEIFRAMGIDPNEMELLLQVYSGQLFD